MALASCCDDVLLCVLSWCSARELGAFAVAWRRATMLLARCDDAWRPSVLGCLPPRGYARAACRREALFTAFGGRATGSLLYALRPPQPIVLLHVDGTDVYAVTSQLQVFCNGVLLHTGERVGKGVRASRCCVGDRSHKLYVAASASLLGLSLRASRFGAASYVPLSHNAYTAISARSVCGLLDRVCAVRGARIDMFEVGPLLNAVHLSTYDAQASLPTSVLVLPCASRVLVGFDSGKAYDASMLRARSQRRVASCRSAGKVASLHLLGTVHGKHVVCLVHNSGRVVVACGHTLLRVHECNALSATRTPYDRAVCALNAGSHVALASSGGDVDVLRARGAPSRHRKQQFVVTALLADEVHDRVLVGTSNGIVRTIALRT